jgi:hypothetical protein
MNAKHGQSPRSVGYLTFCRMRITPLVVFAVAGSLQTAWCSPGPWQLRLLNETQSARCLDSSAPGYFFHRGANTKDFVFHLEGVSH